MINSKIEVVVGKSKVISWYNDNFIIDTNQKILFWYYHEVISPFHMETSKLKPVNPNGIYYAVVIQIWFFNSLFLDLEC